MRLIAATQSHKTNAKAVKLPALNTNLVLKKSKILGIDIENYPLWYAGGDYVFDRTFCISSKWVGSADYDISTFLLDWRDEPAHLVELLAPLREQIEEADLLLGHNFKHDHKGLKSVFNELQQPYLPDKKYIDTMRCIPGGMQRSLEYLCDKFDLGEKPHLSSHDWVEAIEKRDPEKIAKVKNRNQVDVLLTERLYLKEQELGWID